MLPVDWAFHRISEQDWRSHSRDILKGIFGYAGISLFVIIPLGLILLIRGLYVAFFDPVALLLPDWIPITTVILLIISTSFLLGVIFDITIKTLQGLRYLVTNLWVAHTPPFQDDKKQNLSSAPGGDPEIYQIAQAKFFESVGWSTILLGIEIIIVITGAFVYSSYLGPSSLKFDWAIPLVSYIFDDLLSRIPILGDMLAILFDIPFIPDPVIAASLIPALPLTFASQNGSYVFGEVWISRNRRETYGSKKYLFFLIWGPLATIIFIALALLIYIFG